MIFASHAGTTSSKLFLRWALFFISVAVMASFAFSSDVFAQGATAAATGADSSQLITAGDVGLSEIQKTSGLGNQSFAKIVGNIIRIFLSLLGVICISLIIYAGFVWMTAGGAEESVEKAKKTLVNAGIGLLIVFSAFAITEFVMRSLIGATGAKLTTGTEVGTSGGYSGDLGTSSAAGSGAGGFAVKSIEPKGNQQYANLQIAAITNAAIDSDSVKKNFVVKDAAGVVVPGQIKIEGDTIVFIPDTPCPAPNTTMRCFVAGQTFTVTLTGGKDGIIAAVSKKPLACAGTSCTMTFVAGNKVDNIAPTISNTKPVTDSKVPLDSIIPVEALMRDENALLFGRLTVDNVIVETLTAPQFQGSLSQELLLQSKKFTTQNNKQGDKRTIVLTARDVAGNQTSQTIVVTTAAQHCFNKVKDGDEMAIDCSPPNGLCGLCTNGACTKTTDCSNGSSCDATKKTCGTSPVIDGVTPKDGAPGNIISITGQGFGTSVGTVVFLGDLKNTKDDVTAPLACGEQAAWSHSRIAVEIPKNAVSGPILVRTTAGSFDVTDDADGVWMTVFTINAVERPGLCTITPSIGEAGKTEVVISGNNAFLTQQVSRQIFFNGYAATKMDWNQIAPALVKATVPAMPAGSAEVHAVIKGMNSNPLDFMVMGTGGSVSAAATAAGSGATGSPAGKTGTSTGTSAGTSGGTSGVAGATAAAPTINAILPQKGGAGQYLTIHGSGFGTTPNKIILEKINTDGALSGLQINSDSSLPAQCAQTFWSDKQVITKLPDAGLGDYAVLVYPYGISKPVVYKKITMTGDKPGPQVCSVQPNNGPADGSLTVTFFGENFGVTPGKALFTPGIEALSPKLAQQWQNSAASVIVPAKVTSGNSSIKVGDANSNPVLFTVSDCRTKQNACAAGLLCCGDGTCQKDCVAASKKLQAAFAWCFSTGDSCDASAPPTIKEECVKSADFAKSVPSPAPSSAWTPNGEVCANARITVRFTEPIDPQTVTTYLGTNSSLYVEKCIGDATDVCAKMDPALVMLSDVTFVSSDQSKMYALFATPKQLAPDSTYRVSLTSDLIGADSGLPLVAPKTNLSKCVPSGKAVYCFTFKTQKTTAPCEVDAVGVSPSAHTADALGVILSQDTTKPAPLQWVANPYPKDHCQVLDPTSFSWKWQPVKSGEVGFEFTHALQSTSAASTYFAKQPTPQGKPVALTVTETESKKSATSQLTINPGAPKVYEGCVVSGTRSPTPSTRWSTDPVCPEAVIAVEFNQEVVAKQASGADATTIDFKLFECTGTKAGKECDTVDTNSVPAKLEIQKPIVSDARYPYQLVPNATLKTNAWYLAELGTSTKGVGQYGKQMEQAVGCRKGVAYCFSFKTAADLSSCAVKKVEVDPYTYIAESYGVQTMTTYNKDGVPTEAQKTWTAKSFGADSCVILKSGGSWSWFIDPDHKLHAAFDPDNKLNDASPEQTVAAYQETKSNEAVRLSATTQQVAGVAQMTIRFPNPTVEAYEPGACNTGICKNSQISITFSTPMALQTLAQSFRMAECPSVEKDTSGACAFSEDEFKKVRTTALAAAFVSGSTKKLLLTAPAGAIKSNTRYRIFMTGTPRSTAGKVFVGFNYPSERPYAFSWSFSIGDNDCPIKSIAVEPAAPFAAAQGQSQLFVAQPKSESSACFPNGQSLVASQYTWQWSSSDTTVAVATSQTVSSTQTFIMAGAGAVKDGYQQATIEAKALGAAGSAVWKLQCNATAQSCPVGTVLGADKCCHLPPQVTEKYPAGGAQGVCRNTLIKAIVNDALAAATVNTSTVHIGIAPTTGGCAAGAKLDDGYCYGPITFDAQVVNETTKAGARTGTVFINLNTLLPQNTAVRVELLPLQMSNVAQGGAAINSTASVPIEGTQWSFITGPQPCALTSVETYPKNFALNTLGQKQNVIAYGLSKQGSTSVPLSGIADQYDWSWSWHTTKQVVAVFDLTSTSEKSIVTTGGENGIATISGIATIASDVYFTPSTKGKKVVGTSVANAMICEDPWESQYDSVTHNALGAQNISLWYCMKQNTGTLPSIAGTKDTIADMAQADQFTVLHAFHLTDPAGSGGAIGVRVEKNLKHHTPETWFYEKEFKGTPQKIIVGGMPAVRVGNTVYIAYGVKIGNGDQYTYMLVISLSSGASVQMQEVFEQLLAHIQFATNLKDVGLCGVGEQVTDVACNSDVECPSTLVAFEKKQEKQTVQTPTTIMPPPSDDKQVLCLGEQCTVGGNRTSPSVSCSTTDECYGAFDAANKKMVCEANYCYHDGNPLGIECNSVTDCKIDFAPKGISTSIRMCENFQCVIDGKKYSNLSCWNDQVCYNYDVSTVTSPPPTPPPSLEGPTYCLFERTKFIRDTIRVLDAATLSHSLEQAQAIAKKYPIVATGSFVPGLVSSKWPGWESFMQQLGIAPVVDPVNAYAACGSGFDSQTCWNAATKLYQCGATSRVYHYKTVNSGEGYELGIPFEQSSNQVASWRGEIQTLLSGAQKKINTAFCTNTPFSPSSVCGDGAVAASESCDPPGTKLLKESTDVASFPYGAYTAMCSAQCTLDNVQPVNKCGDGVVQEGPPELCDEGIKYNGLYNHCPKDCGVVTKSSVSELGACGNGKIEKNEVCDVAQPVGKFFKFGLAYYNIVQCKAGIDATKLPRSQYSYNKDKIILGETVDFDKSFFQQAISDINKFCSGQAAPYGFCKKHPEMGCSLNNNNENCLAGDICVPIVTGARYATTKADSCNYDCKGTGPYCGDGFVSADFGEQCDGTQTTTANGAACKKVCTNACTWANVATDGTPVCEPIQTATSGPPAPPPGCGDGTVNSASGEECDSGLDCSTLTKNAQGGYDKPCKVGGTNGTQCTPQYGQTSCQYCTTSCKKAYMSGGQCGDGIRNGTEVCDGKDLSGFCDPTKFQYATYTCKKDCSGVQVATNFIKGQIVVARGQNKEPRLWWTAEVLSPEVTGEKLLVRFLDDNSQAAVPLFEIAVRGLELPKKAGVEPFPVGTPIFGKYKDKFRWYEGAISAIDSEKYSIAYDDGDTEQNVPIERLAYYPGGCVACRESTIAFSKAKPAGVIPSMKKATTARDATFSFNDPTLGYMPNYVIYQVQHDGIDASSGTLLPVSTASGVANQVVPLHLDVGVGNSCFVAHKYQILMIPNADSAKPWGGAFSYMQKGAYPIFPLDQNVTPKTYDVWPYGEEGDYRVVLHAPKSQLREDTYINWTITPKKSGDAVFSGGGSGYNLNGDLYPSSSYSNCPDNGYLSKDKFIHVVAVDSGYKTAFMWRDGCISSAPRVQLEQMYPSFENNNYFYHGKSVTTLRRSFPDKDAYYAGVFQPSVQVKGGVADKNILVVIYFYTGGKWQQVAALRPGKNGSIDSGNNQIWYPFFFMPGQKKDGNNLIGTTYRPNAALYQGKYVSGQSSKLLIE